MLNRVFKKGLFLIFTGIISIIFISCEKEKETIGIIIVKDFNNNTISGATVTLHQDSLFNDYGIYVDDPNAVTPSPNAPIRRTEKTDANGRAQFTYTLEAILNIEVVKESGNNTLLGENVLRLEQGKTITKVVKIH